MNNHRLKELGDGGYFKELLAVSGETAAEMIEHRAVSFRKLRFCREASGTSDAHDHGRLNKASGFHASQADRRAVCFSAMWCSSLRTLDSNNFKWICVLGLILFCLISTA